jgi:hypothetical protein
MGKHTSALRMVHDAGSVFFRLGMLDLPAMGVLRLKQNTSIVNFNVTS